MEGLADDPHPSGWRIEYVTRAGARNREGRRAASERSQRGSAKRSGAVCGAVGRPGAGANPRVAFSRPGRQARALRKREPWACLLARTHTARPGGAGFPRAPRARWCCEPCKVFARCAARCVFEGPAALSAVGAYRARPHQAISARPRVRCAPRIPPAVSRAGSCLQHCDRRAWACCCTVHAHGSTWEARPGASSLAALQHSSRTSRPSARANAHWVRAHV